MTVGNTIHMSGERFEVHGGAGCTGCGGMFSQISDSRLKTGVEDIASGLDVLIRLRAVGYFYTNELRARAPSVPSVRQYGFIAQEFQQVFPDSVTTGADGFLHLNAGSVLPHVVKGVQELTDIIIGQSDEIGALQSQVDAQQAQIDELQRLISQIVSGRENPGPVVNGPGPRGDRRR